MDTVIPRIVLASASPRRKMLLEQLGIKFDVISSDIHENIEHSLLPEQFAETLALRKAQAIAASLSKSIVIGADTIVVDKVGILGKPKDEVDAYRMLARLSGQVHRVITGLALISTQSSSKTLVRHETTKVKIATLSDQDIGWYIRTGEPLDKAGAYAIQGKGTMFVEWIHGCYNNVVGLPLFLLVTMLREINNKFYTYM
jgi:septum formation protein